MVMAATVTELRPARPNAHELAREIVRRLEQVEGQLSDIRVMADKLVNATEDSTTNASALRPRTG